MFLERTCDIVKTDSTRPKTELGWCEYYSQPMHKVKLGHCSTCKFSVLACMGRNILFLQVDGCGVYEEFFEMIGTEPEGERIYHTARYVVWTERLDVTGKPQFGLTPLHFLRLPSR
jgi:hypothetical protein